MAKKIIQSKNCKSFYNLLLEEIIARTPIREFLLFTPVNSAQIY
jgi:hypothetical protein